MNSLVRAAVILIIAVSFTACEKSTDPVTPPSLDRANIQVSALAQSGIFEITFPDSRSSGDPITLTGSIYFRFDDATSTYKYTGMYNKSNRENHSGTIESSGRFERKGNYINLIDDPFTQSSTAQSTLLLYGDYQYSESGNQTIIEGKTQMGHIKIILNQ